MFHIYLGKTQFPFEHRQRTRCRPTCEISCLLFFTPDLRVARKTSWDVQPVNLITTLQYGPYAQAMNSCWCHSRIWFDILYQVKFISKTGCRYCQQAKELFHIISREYDNEVVTFIIVDIYAASLPDHLAVHYTPYIRLVEMNTEIR